LCGYSRSLLERGIILTGTECNGIGLWLVGVKLVVVIEQGVRVVGGTANIVGFLVWLQQIISLAGDCVNRNEMQRVGFAVSGVKVGLMEQGVRVAGGTANIVSFVVWLKQIVIIAGECVNRNGMKWVGVVVSRVKWGDGTGFEGSR
jgi:hypothetical protein